MITETICLIFEDILKLITGYYFMKILSCCLKRRGKRLAHFLEIVLYSCVAANVIYPQDMVNITLGLLVFFVCNFIFYQGKWIIKVSLVIILLPIASAANLLENDIGAHIFFQFYTEKDQVQNAVFSCLFFTSIVIFWIAFYHFLGRNLEKMRDVFTDKAWKITDIICVASFAGTFSCIYLSPEITSYLIWPCMAACIVTNMGSIRLASYLADGMLADLERKNLQMQKIYYEELENNQKQIRKIRHDMNNHLAVIGQLLRKGENAQAEAYFEQISEYMQTANRKFCSNSVVNAVLNAKYNLMAENQIDGFFHIGIDHMLFIDDISLCTIFANTLDNAIEACRKIEDIKQRRLQLKCRYTDNGYFSFELVNSKKNEVTLKKGRYISDKEDKRAHGIGISSVKEIVEKYQGTLDIFYDETSFRVLILIGS